MFRFDSFRSQSQATPTTNTTREDSQAPPEESKIKFLQRIASSDSIDKKSLTKRPSFSSMSSFSGRSGSSSSTIPVPSNSWGMLMLSTLRNDDMLEDVCSLLTKDQKATLLLPVSQPSHPSAIIDREFIEDHVMLYQSPVDMTQIVSLSGIRGTFQKDRFVALGLVERPSVHGIAASNADSSSKTRFDSFSLDPMSITSDHPSINILASHVDVTVANDQTITVMLIQKPVSRQEIQDWSEAKESGIIVTSPELVSSEDDINSERISPRIIEQIQRFITSFRRRPPKNLDAAGMAVQSLLRDVESNLEKEKHTLDEHARAVKVSLSPYEVDQKMEWVENYVCRELYDSLFTSPNGDDTLHDEALVSRIAALNLLDLDLAHLGVIVDEGDDIAEIDEAVKNAGHQLQKLESSHAARDKMEHLLRTNTIIADALERFAESHKSRATVDEDATIVKEMQHAMSAMTEEKTPNEDAQDTESAVTTTASDSPEKSDDDSTEDQVDDDSGSAPLLASQNSAVDTKATPDSTDMARNASETSSEINLQFPPAQSKRPRRDDDQYIRSAGADVLLPLLIYTVVKSNPQKFVSNLKFIQRYRMSSKLIGEASYCLTNMLAVVAFLETTNLVGLGLSADRIMSDLSDLQAGSGSHGLNSKQRFRSPQVDQLAGGGRKLVSDVVDGVFDGIGRFWRTPETTSSASPPVLPPPTNTNKTVGGLLSMPGMAAMEEVKNQVVGRVRGASDASSIKSQEARKQNELKEMSRTHTNDSVDTQDSRPLWQRSNSQSRSDMFQSMLQAPSQFMASVVPRPSSAASSTTPIGEGPLQKFLEMKSVEEMKIGEVAELLADYKRLAAIIKQSQL
ncbi:hypothetical protein BC943DRAFT_351671 [Umbelopsis sp. AD052]|nr:hypothetical protein BC943DRAFT_351671 [Umbelopsis sp. AD052]